MNGTPGLSQGPDAAALTGRSLEHLLEWVSRPLASTEPAEILREHPHAAPFWEGLLHGALRGDSRTAGNTVTTVQQAMSLFFQAETRRRCVPGHGRPATDIADVIARGGTIYLLGREDPYASASPLMTAFAEHVLDTALAAAQTSPWGRLAPPFHVILDELPSTAPLPTLRTRMANERALGISFIWAAQAWPQLTSIFGEAEARTLLGLTNNLIVFGGSKDVAFNREISDLMGNVRVSRSTWQTGSRHGRTYSGEDIPILTGAEIRQLQERHALVLAENGIIGMAVWLAFVGYGFWMMMRILRHDPGFVEGEEEQAWEWYEDWRIALVLLAALVGFFTAAFFLSRSYVILLYLLAAVVVAHFAGVRDRHPDLPALGLRAHLVRWPVLAVATAAGLFVVVKVLLALA